MIVLFVVLALIAPNFLTSRNLLNVLRAVSFNGIIACSITLMIIQGDIDVSIGSAVAWSSSPSGPGDQDGLAAWTGGPVVLAQGMLIHALAGYIRVRWLVPSFVLTLALFMMLRGAARQITNAFPISPFPAGFEFWGGGTIDILGLGLPVPVLIMLIVFVIFYIVSTRTVFGRSVYCVGGNEHAARLSGINVGKTRIISFMLVGLLSAFVGILLSSRIQSGSSQIALGLEFEVIAAVIIGGTSLMGGAGSISAPSWRAVHRAHRQRHGAERRLALHAGNRPRLHHPRRRLRQHPPGRHGKEGQLDETRSRSLQTHADGGKLRLCQATAA
ncbi:MAG: ABC transporter permease [Paracoccaceae bacterium]